MYDPRLPPWMEEPAQAFPEPVASWSSSSTSSRLYSTTSPRDGTTPASLRRRSSTNGASTKMLPLSGNGWRPSVRRQADWTPRILHFRPHHQRRPGGGGPCHRRRHGSGGLRRPPNPACRCHLHGHRPLPRKSNGRHRSLRESSEAGLMPRNRTRTSAQEIPDMPEPTRSRRGSWSVASSPGRWRSERTLWQASPHRSLALHEDKVVNWDHLVNSPRI